MKESQKVVSAWIMTDIPSVEQNLSLYELANPMKTSVCVNCCLEVLRIWYVSLSHNI